VLNPIVEGLQLISRTTRSVGARVRSGVSYPGLAEMIDAFYGAVVRGGESPVLSPATCFACPVSSKSWSRTSMPRRRSAAYARAARDASSRRGDRRPRLSRRRDLARARSACAHRPGGEPGRPTRRAVDRSPI